MPQQQQQNKKKKKKGRAPAHQNKFAFHHNPKSKLTDKILQSPNVHVCRRCHEKIEWRKKYRKYKPRTQPGRCNLCSNRNVLAAYHTICAKCTTSQKALAQLTTTHNNKTTTDEGDDDPLAAAETITTSTATPTLEEPLDGPLLTEEEASSSSSLCLAAARSSPAPTRACAMCVREPALPDPSEGPETIDDILARETRRIRLRERKALERKLARQQEEAKQAAREARRKEREGALPTQSKQEEEESEGDDSSSVDPTQEDPLLAAVGGADKLLTGEAYQKMLLERHQRPIQSNS